jgi:CheY-like chemotaxis protein
MATFGKRVQPKHRASPGDRQRTPAPAAKPGAHAASVPADSAPEAPAAPAPAAPAPVAEAPDSPDAVAPTPAAAAPVVPDPTQAPTLPEPEPTPAPTLGPAPELVAPMPPELPAAPVSVSEPGPSTAEPDNLRVLIVDDNEDVRGLLRIAFARADIEVVGAAGDFREALAMAQRGGPGIILLDVNLPGMAGLDLLPRLREHCPEAKVVMFSAQVGSQVTEAAMEGGAVGFVEKGVSMKNVITHLRDVARAPEAHVVEPFPLRVYA